MKLLNALLDLLYPPRCVFCSRLLRDASDPICPDCRAHLPCTGPSAEVRGLSPIAKCVAPLYYEGKVRESLHRFKFAQRTGYAGIYAGIIGKCIDENEIFCDSITWVPVSARRLRKRGYDQSRLLAEKLAQRTGLPCEALLKKVRHTRPQSLTGDYAKRKANAKNAYRCTAPELAKGKRILLVDDIVTSGATLSECARMLRAAGAAEVFAAAVARKRE
jgi:ComF family protein